MAGPSGSGAADVATDWTALLARLPIGRDTQSSLRRGELFLRFDVNQNSMLSLTEVDRAVREVLGLDSTSPIKSLIMRAFEAAKVSNKKKQRLQATSRRSSSSCVGKDEFRLLLFYLRQYFQLLIAFNRDDISDGTNSIQQAEFPGSLDVLKQSGIDVDGADADQAFASMDVSSAGSISFDDFCRTRAKPSLRSSNLRPCHLPGILTSAAYP